ncbi:MAG: hypothetical protein JWP31_2445 [Aeromicrobium sp.]|nr:hypothetical protein [Aeromicrobium sp.]
MDRPFSERVADDDWRRQAEAWIVEQLGAQGVEVTGHVEQPRIRPWSTQLTVPTSSGRVWFKASCRAMAFEARLHEALARIAPGSVDAPCAVDPARGWMLTFDRGATLGDEHDPTLDDWQRVLREATRLQRTAASHRDELLATGLPDCSPATVVDRFDRLLEIFAALPDDHPASVPPTVASQLRLTRPALVDAAATLAESRLPVTWQHGDLHPWNVFAADGSIFDFGDAQWSHGVELLSVPYGWITSRSSLVWDEVREAYADGWGVDAAALDDDWAATCLTQPVNRAMTWWGCLQEATAAEWREWGEAPVHHLTRVLDP